MYFAIICASDTSILLFAFLLSSKIIPENSTTPFNTGCLYCKQYSAPAGNRVWLQETKQLAIDSMLHSVSSYNSVYTEILQ